MSPFAITVIFILTMLFGVLSLTTVLAGPGDIEPFDTDTASKTKPAH